MEVFVPDCAIIFDIFGVAAFPPSLHFKVLLKSYLHGAWLLRDLEIVSNFNLL